MKLLFGPFLISCFVWFSLGLSLPYAIYWFIISICLTSISDLVKFLLTDGDVEGFI